MLSSFNPVTMKIPKENSENNVSCNNSLKQLQKRDTAEVTPNPSQNIWKIQIQKKKLVASKLKN